jgi:putative methyltransferase (TIGR04325 family)
VSEAYRRYFNAATGSHVRLFRGVFSDFEAARRAIPPGRIESYDNEPSAQRMIGEWMNIDASDYPVMFWLANVLPAAQLVFDWGGNVGLKYFAFRRYLNYSSALTWLVNDVPAVVALGETVARNESATALQFIDDPLARMSEALRLPRHLILSKLPVYDASPAVTLHSMGTALCPYHLFNRSAFISGVEALGFVLCDEWTSPNVGCQIPFHPDRSIAAYTGFYFRRRA